MTIYQLAGYVLLTGATGALFARHGTGSDLALGAGLRDLRTSAKVLTAVADAAVEAAVGDRLSW